MCLDFKRLGSYLVRIFVHILALYVGGRVHSRVSDNLYFFQSSASLKPHPSKPHPCNMPQAKTEVALQFLECCAAENCTAAIAFLQCGSHLYQKLRCNERKTALQHRNRCVAGKWRFPAAVLRVSIPPLGSFDTIFGI